MRALVKRIFQGAGFEVRRRRPEPPPGSEFRQVGDFRSFLEDLKARGFVPRTILDVGANEAGWSADAKAVFPEAACFLIEPQEEMKPALEAFCARFKDCAYFLAGAGAVPGELALTVYDDLVGSSFLPGESSAMLEAGKQRRVPIVTIDGLVAEGRVPAPDLAKLDVQGFELDVLKGAADSLKNIEVVILEVSLFRFEKNWPVLHEVVAFMQSRGFAVYDFAGFMRRPRDGALGQADVCFARENGILRQSSNWSK